MGYALLDGVSLVLAGYEIVSLRQEDILKIKGWRNAQMPVLRQKKMLTDEDQRRYYEQVVEPTFSQEKPPIVLVSYLHQGACIGYGGLVYIDWECKRAEVSFLLDSKRAKNEVLYCAEFATYLTLIKRLAFHHLGFNRLFTETFEGRTMHESVLEKNGFKLEGCLRQHVFKEGAFHNSHMHGILKEDVIFK